jgi:DNA-binding protein HU-beta
MVQKAKVVAKITNKITLVSKKILTDRVSEKIGRKNNLTKLQTEAVISQLLEEIKLSLIKGEEIRFPGYLSLKTVITKPRVAMNLQTKKKMNVPAKRVPKVRFSVDLKETIAKKK